MKVEIPDGYVLVPKGGRPTKHARDIAVHLATRWRLERNPKKWCAYEWAFQTWPTLKDDAGVRKAIRKAHKHLPKSYLLLPSAGGAILYETVKGTVLPCEGGVLWAWSEGDMEATECRQTAVRATFDWRQTYQAWKDRSLFKGGE